MIHVHHVHHHVPVIPRLHLMLEALADWEVGVVEAEPEPGVMARGRVEGSAASYPGVHGAMVKQRGLLGAA